jgi:hypothetical protein
VSLDNDVVVVGEVAGIEAHHTPDVPLAQDYLISNLNNASLVEFCKA